jgi:hypothetical protein
MVLTVIISALAVLGMIAAVLIKPYIKVKGHKLGLYWIITLVGAILLLVFGCIPLSSAVKV